MLGKSLATAWQWKPLLPTYNSPSIIVVLNLGVITPPGVILYVSGLISDPLYSHAAPQWTTIFVFQITISNTLMILYLFYRFLISNSIFSQIFSRYKNGHIKKNFHNGDLLLYWQFCLYASGNSCRKILSAENMKPSKLKDHFERIHKWFEIKHIEYFEISACWNPPVWIIVVSLRRQMKVFLRQPVILISELQNVKTSCNRRGCHQTCVVEKVSLVLEAKHTAKGIRYQSQTAPRKGTFWIK